MTETERKVYERCPIPLAVYTYAENKVIPLLVSDGFCRLKGLEREKLAQVLAHGIYDEVHPDDVGALKRVASSFLRKASNYDAVYRTFSANTKDYRLVHALGKWHMFDDGTAAVIVVYNDLADSVNEIGKYYEDYLKIVQDQFYTDTVTGLPNMNYMKQFADQRADKLRLLGKTPALVYFDIRSMHNYNYDYGYARGDELLRMAAKEIKAALPEALTGRSSDDHFIAITEYTDDLLDTAKALVEKIRKNAYGKVTAVQASLVKMEPDLKAVDALDRARHVIKDIGDDLNVTVGEFSQESNEDYWMRRYIVQSFDKAMENNWIQVYYQPIVRTSTKKISILEALARWIDPVRGVISPGEFVPVLSRYHQVYKLDLYMAEQICREFGERKQAGLPPIPVSVNFSAQDFDYVDVCARLDALMEKYAVDKGRLIVEVTEQDIAQGKEQFRNQLQKLHDRGYRLWVDDFGSGYSSLNVFGRYKVDRIKFDMEMLRQLDENGGANRIIMKSIVDMCRRIGVHTLAEGVETKEQYAFLKEIRCEMAQGFYFYKPKPLEVSIFMARNSGAVAPCESSEERQRLGEAWLTGENVPDESEG